MEHPQSDSAPATPVAPVPAAATMRAIVQDAYGDADGLRLEQIAVPLVGPDDVLIEVCAAGVHIGDWHVMTGQPYLMRLMGFGFRGPKAHVRGMDVAGTVKTVGAKVTQFHAGDEVFGACDGAFAEYATARVEKLAAKPAGLTFVQAAAIPTSGCTALQALRDTGKITAGQRVLIIGASGGVGLFAVQIAKALGAEVTGVCSGAKVDLVRSVGADHVIDYTDTDITTSGQRYDLVLDMGGDRTLSQLRRCLTPRGTLVLVGGEGGGRLIGGAMVRSLRAVALSPFVKQSLRMVLGTTRSEDLQALAALIDSGKISLVIDRSYPLDEAADAIRHLHTGRPRGKLVITI
ncbi:NAD(P)-dependent alcohol dehydrogenase [Microlunatus ginsengisoli]|uniref:NAD(P)-dependent alcohol dehydrogenase n=1 Tax=Microlunatus ginsengisoli TaxID=363863 RepID=A0ABP7ANU0_9ACTN